MNSPRFLSRPLALSLVLAGCAGAAFAQDGGLTREQVAAETRAAQAAGAIPHGDLDISARNGGTDTAPARTARSLATRAQVEAEAARAIAAGEIPVGDSGRTPAEIDPSRHPHPAASGLTRAQVLADLARAERDGDMEFGDSGRTLAQTFPERYAAARARDGEPDARYAAN